MKLSIRTKLVLAVNALLLASSAVVGFAVWKSSDATATASGEMLAGTANNTMDRISRTLYERYGDVQAFAANRAAFDTENWKKWEASNPLIATMNDYVRLYGMYTATVLVDLKGDVVAVNTLDASGKPANTESLRGKNFGGEQWFKNAIAGKFYTAPGMSATGTVVDDVGFDPIIKAVTGGDGLGLAFSAPVQDAEGKTIGVWRNVADFKFIEEAVTDSYKDMKSTGMHLELQIVDAKGVVWMDYDPTSAGTEDVKRDLNVIGKTNIAGSPESPAAKALKGELGFDLNWNHEHKNESFAVGYAPRMEAMGFPGMDWAVLARVPRSEALALQHRVVGTVIGGLVFANVVCAIGGVLVVGWLLRPVRGLIARLTDVAGGEGDLTQKLDESRSDEMGEVAKQFNLFCEKMRGVVAEVMRSADEVAAAAVEISAGTDTLLAGVRDQHGKSTQVAAAVEEATASIAQVAQSSNAANTAAEQAGAAAADGGKEVQGTVGVIEQIAVEVEGTAQSIESLGKRSEEIGRIATVINDIADQTNLLALNAAIEAARAGEHGRGFAVVADEVRKLAERTAHATGEIASSIRSIQTEANEAVSRMQRGSEQVRGGVDQARRAGAALDRIVSSAREVAGMVNSIAATSQEQSKATEEIAAAVSGIATVTESFGKSTEETASACLMLSKKAESLRHLVGQFNTNRRKAAARRAIPGVDSDLGPVTDLSETGAQIQMRSGASISPAGTNLTLRSGGRSVTVRAKQKWAADKNGKPHVGLEFEKPVDNGIAEMTRNAPQR